MSVECILKRNLNWANGIRYELNQVHSPQLVDMLNTVADHSLLDAQILSVDLRSKAAYHEDRGCIYICQFWSVQRRITVTCGYIFYSRIGHIETHQQYHRCYKQVAVFLIDYSQIEKESEIQRETST